jgi:hypothetical protein
MDPIMDYITPQPYLLFGPQSAHHADVHKLDPTSWSIQSEKHKHAPWTCKKCKRIQEECQGATKGISYCVVKQVIKTACLVCYYDCPGLLEEMS